LWLSLAFVAVACSQSHAQRHISILWFGNSYICDNRAGPYLDDAVEQLINASHDSGLTDVVVDSSGLNCLWSRGLLAHYEDSGAMAMLRNGHYTYLVMQGYIKTDDTTMMRTSAEETIGSACLLADEARAVGAVPVIYCAHPRCDATPEMWQYVIDAYQKAADSSHSLFVPVSVAWRDAMAEVPGFELYQGDCIHQNRKGVFLNAAVFYCLFTGSSVVGNTAYVVGLSFEPDTAAFMQRIAWTVFDSVQRANPQPVSPRSPAEARLAPLSIRSQGQCVTFVLDPAAAGGELAIFGIDGRVAARLPVAGRVVAWRAPEGLAVASRGPFSAVAYARDGSRVACGWFVR
jgi:hypothetical protein